MWLFVIVINQSDTKNDLQILALKEVSVSYIYAYSLQLKTTYYLSA